MRSKATPPKASNAAATAAALGVALLISGEARAAVRRLLVFLHVAVKQRALQSDLNQALPGVVVTAVGRPADFDRALSEGQDAVLTLPVLLSSRGLAPKLRGHRQGSAEEKYLLVAADVPPDPARVAAVGALDILGREGTNSFVHGLVSSRPRVERVTKIEDLLPLLQMQRVSAILLPSRFYAEIRASSRLNLAQRELATPVGLPAAASVGPAGSEVLAAVSRLPPKLTKLLGVDEWR
ncbi:MAG TPA: hypothetical protein VFZ53_10060 [Polyangiaceae bacterium]